MGDFRVLLVLGVCRDVEVQVEAAEVGDAFFGKIAVPSARAMEGQAVLEPVRRPSGTSFNLELIRVDLRKSVLPLSGRRGAWQNCLPLLIDE